MVRLGGRARSERSKSPRPTGNSAHATDNPMPMAERIVQRNSLAGSLKNAVETAAGMEVEGAVVPERETVVEHVPTETVRTETVETTERPVRRVTTTTRVVEE